MTQAVLPDMLPSNVYEALVILLEFGKRPLQNILEGVGALLR